MARRTGLTVEHILAEHMPPIRAVAEGLRTIMLETVPGIDERVYAGWHAFGYVHPAARYLGGIFPRAEHVSLAFEWGRHLPDPAGVLTGEGKRVRMIVLDDPEVIPRQEIAELIHAAVAYGTARYAFGE
jgi:hypothetical protein